MATYKNEVILKDGTKVLFRSAEETDAEKMIVYLNAVGGESDNLLFGKDGFHLTVEQERVFLKNAKEDPNMLMLLGFIDDILVSIVHLSSLNRARIAHYSDLAISVKKEYWHRGIGSAAMNELITYAKDKGTIKTISLGVRDINYNAIKLYEKFGFEKVGAHKNYFNIDGKYYDEILMDLYLE